MLLSEALDTGVAVLQLYVFVPLVPTPKATKDPFLTDERVTEAVVLLAKFAGSDTRYGVVSFRFSSRKAEICQRVLDPLLPDREIVTSRVPAAATWRQPIPLLIVRAVLYASRVAALPPIDMPVSLADELPITNAVTTTKPVLGTTIFPMDFGVLLPVVVNEPM